MHRFREQEEQKSGTFRIPAPPTTTERQEERSVQPQAEAAAVHQEGKGFWASVMRENPVLHKELRSIFFPAKQTESQRKLQRLVAGVTATAIYAAVMLAMREILKGMPAEAHQTAWYVLYGILIGIQSIILLAAPLTRLPATIAREREKQTWNALLLSRLSAETILGGKYVSGLISSLVALLFFLPLTVLAAVLGGVSVVAVGMGMAVLVAMAAMLAMTSLYASWKQETTVKANNEAGLWMLGLVFGAAGFWGLGSLLWGILSYFLTGAFSTPMPDFWRTGLQVPAWLNPFVALWATSMPDGSTQILPIVKTLLPLTFLAFSTTVSVKLWKRMVKNFWAAPRDFSG
ncbi:MAG: ABC transporter permease subunit [Armatimonas sp.]